MPILSLELHGRYGRKEAFAAVGISFTQQNRRLLTGLSPRCPDGGYFIFITIDKQDLDPAYAYDDELFERKFHWVTRRGPDQDDPDYVAVGDRRTRVSLFVRHRDKDRFAYLGELRFRTHTQFVAEDGRTQQEYMFDLVDLSHLTCCATSQEETLNVPEFPGLKVAEETGDRPHVVRRTWMATSEPFPMSWAS